jgi:cation diffusion facilitator family transporter
MVSVWVNTVLSIAQIAGGWLTHSQALIADGIHSLSDLLSDFVVLLALRHSRKAADVEHPYGHHRFENAASLALGLVLLAVGLGMAWSASVKLQDPDGIPAVHSLALYMAGFTLVCKEWLFRYLLRIAQRLRSSMLVANAWHARSDALSSLVVGIGIAGNLMGYPLLDAVAALVVGLMITRMGAQFAWHAFNDLTDRAADAEMVADIEQALLGTPGVLGVHDLKTRKSGDMVLVDVHLDVDGTLSIQQGHDIAEAAQDRVMKAHRVLSVMAHLDPVNAEAAACRQKNGSA